MRFNENRSCIEITLSPAPQLPEHRLMKTEVVLKFSRVNVYLSNDKV